MYKVYILKSKTKTKSYVGITNNIARRLEEHNKGRSIFTRRFMPWKLIYEESFLTRKEARMREKYLKSAAGRKLLKEKLFADD